MDNADIRRRLILIRETLENEEHYGRLEVYDVYTALRDLMSLMIEETN